MCARGAAPAGAKFALGHFDRVLPTQHRALSEELESKAAAHRALLERLEPDFAQGRDENSPTHVAEWSAKLEELERQIAAFEADPEALMRLAHKR